MKIVYFFCIDPAKDKVAPAVFESSRKLLPLETTNIQIEGLVVLRINAGDGFEYYFVPTREVVSHDYRRYLPIMNSHFGSFDMAGVVNWHEGANAPDQIFCVHTTGDILSGTFGAANPKLTTSVAVALDRTRLEAGMADWSALPEATHFSGILYGIDPMVITQYAVPVIDIEIGSSPESWSNEQAIEVMVRSLVRLSEFVDHEAPSMMFVGGTHFEPSVQNAVIIPSTGGRFAFSHVFANHWVAAGGYWGDDGIAKLRGATNSICGGVDLLVFHDALKGAVKETVRALGNQLGIPVIKHKRLREGVIALQT